MQITGITRQMAYLAWVRIEARDERGNFIDSREVPVQHATNVRNKFVESLCENFTSVRAEPIPSFTKDVPTW